MLANIHRPGALTPSVVLSLGLGLALLVTLLQIDGNLRQQFVASFPDKAPSVFFVDIQDTDAARFDEFAKANAPEARYERVPMLRGRIVSVHGTRIEDLKAAPNAAWVLQGDRGITYSDDVPAGSRLVAGEWWKPDYQGPPLVSFDEKIADGLGLKVGDAIVINVLGRNITATVANLRSVDWQSLGINFVMMFSPNAMRGAPHAHIATFTYPGGSTVAQEIALLKAAAHEFPTVTAVRVREALEAVAKLVFDLELRGPRRQRYDADRGRARARGRARDRPSPSRLRRGGVEDARRNAQAADCRIRARISAHRPRDRDRRRRGRIARRVPGDARGDESRLRLAAAAGRGRGACGTGADDRVRPDRHVHGARPEARAGACVTCDFYGEFTARFATIRRVSSAFSAIPCVGKASCSLWRFDHIEPAPRCDVSRAGDGANRRGFDDVEL